MLLMGAITSLPEVAVVTTSASIGNAALATNNLIGSVSINVVLIAAADAVLGRDAITSVVGKPTTLLQGVLVVIALTLTAIAILSGDMLVVWSGLWPPALMGFGVAAFWLSSRYSDRAPWRTVGKLPHNSASRRRDPAAAKRRQSYMDIPIPGLVVRIGVAAATILVAGFVLAQSGDAIAKLSGLGSGIIGLVLVGFATSLPELSSISTAIRLHRYEMALGDVFGTNLLTVGLIFLADLFYPGGPILNQAGRFEAAGALLGVALTSIFLVGLLERQNKTFLRMGYDSVAALVVFAAGITLLYFLSG
jgi:cation:H+ antiporter